MRGQPIIGETAEKEFVRLFGAILRLRNILSSFDQFAERDKMVDRDLQNYQSIYHDLYEKYRHKEGGEKEDVSDDVEFEIELIRQVEINIDYILMLVERYQKSKCEDKEILVTIRQAIKSSPNCRSKQDLIEAFIKRVNFDTKVKEEWQKFVVKRRKEELDKIIASENLKREPTMNFIINSFRDGAVKTTGTDIDKIMPPMSRFGG